MSDVAAELSRAALVSKRPMRPTDPSLYLLLTPEGRAIWIEDPDLATAFPSMREAMRASLRLPAGVRAFGMPREVERGIRRLH